MKDKFNKTTFTKNELIVCEAFERVGIIIFILALIGLSESELGYIIFASMGAIMFSITKIWLLLAKCKYVKKNDNKR
jgi:hypothetical protein